ncbi:MAG: PTS glucose transporter subunit IIA, partial [Lachnospiraceae bacterium]|nr:PTS glucose transporter subunit IIA [Lachnospiraceae bacterium]
KICPAVISMIVVPFCSLVLSVMAAHFVLGPIGWKIGSVISSVVYAGITGPLKVVFGAIFGFVYAPLVITGLHHMSNAIDLQLIADFGGTMLWPMIALSNIAQGSAVLGMIYLQKNDAEAQEVNVPACISCYLGVTEPAMFGVNLKHNFPFISGMIGSACAAVVCAATSSTANAIGVGGLPGILSMQPQSMLSFAICMAIAVAVPFVLTVMLGKKKLQFAGVNAEEVKAVEVVKVVKEESAKTEMKAFATGNVISLAEVNDGVFSAGIMGDGFAIIPENDTIYAPAKGTITVMMEESRHACGILLDSGAEILLHVGLDTVAMKGEGFKYLVKEGQKVQAGTPLIKFDKEKIKAAGYVDTTICVVTDPAEGENMKFITGIHAVAKETTVAKAE